MAGKGRGVFVEDTTLPTSGEPTGVRLVVFGEGEPSSFPLLEAGSHTIGRSLDADIYVKEPSLSRLHACITWDGGMGLSIADLSSSNGTSVRGSRLRPDVPCSFGFGEALELGRATVVVQRSATLGRPRRMWPHSSFELRLEERCVRSRSSNESFALMRVRALGGPPVEAVEKAIFAELGTDDLIAAYAPLEYDVLLAQGGQAEAVEVARALRLRLEAIGATAEIVTASFPRDGREPGELIARMDAGRGRRGTTPGSKNAARVVIEDASMRQLYTLVDRLAGREINILILGETGVGKEIMAKAVHERSPRRAGPFLALNCGAFSEELFESELFGHEKGAFTGAVQMKKGLLESAGQGTLFLDEIGEMSAASQVKLLRAIEERKARRLGGLESVPFDARIVSATNRDLEHEVRGGRFREDLYYRLNGFTLLIPPLRERKAEILALAHLFAKEQLLEEGMRGEPSFTLAAEEALLRYAWPGNVRELRNVVVRAMVLAGSDTIDVRHLPAEKLDSAVVYSGAARAAPTSASPAAVPAPASAFRARMDDVEKAAIMETLDQCGGNQTRAAKLLGMSRKSLLRRLEQYGLPRPRQRSSD